MLYSIFTPFALLLGLECLVRSIKRQGKFLMFESTATFSLNLKAAHNISEGAIDEILSTAKEMTRKRMDCI